MLPFKKYKAIVVCEDEGYGVGNSGDGDISVAHEKLSDCVFQLGYFKRGSVTGIPGLQPKFREFRPQVNFNEEPEVEPHTAREAYTMEQFASLRSCGRPFDWATVLPKPRDLLLDVTCHQCGERTADPKIRCTQCYSATGHLCGPCLQLRYGENLAEVLRGLESGKGSWVCPACRGICNCAKCRERMGYPPASLLLSEYDPAKHASVAHYLVKKFLVDSNGVYTDPDACNVVERCTANDASRYPSNCPITDSCTKASSVSGAKISDEEDSKDQQMLLQQQQNIRKSHFGKAGHEGHHSKNSGNEGSGSGSGSGKSKKKAKSGSSGAGQAAASGEAKTVHYVQAQTPYNDGTLNGYIKKIGTLQQQIPLSQQQQAPPPQPPQQQQQQKLKQQQQGSKKGKAAAKVKAETPKTPKKRKAKEQEYEVEEILDVNEVGEITYYHVKWVGYNETTWEPFENCKGCEKKIVEFHKKYPEKLK